MSSVQRTERTISATDRLLKKLAEGWSIAASCRAAGIARSVYYEMVKDDPDFAARAESAIEEGTDRLEDSATRQAIAGNAALMALLLKARRPEKYRETLKHQHSGVDGEPLTITHVALVPLPTPPEMLDAGDE